MKKIITILLLCCYLFMISVSAGQGQLQQKVMLDELYTLGIMRGDEKGDLHLEDTITRAEAIKMICVAGESVFDEQKNVTTMFPDVPQTHWAYDYVYMAKANGITVGDDKGNFNPESMITNEEIIKMIVSLLGYAIRAETQGGFPAGYTSVAAQTGITNGLELDIQKPALRQHVAIMIYNAPYVPLMIETDDNTWMILDGNNGVQLKTLKD